MLKISVSGWVMSVKEKIVGAVQSSNLRWNENEEKAIDRITALGLSDPLGSALFRFKYCNDSAAYQRALALLAKKGATRLKVMPGYARMLAKAAIKEWAVDADPHCQGSGLFMQKNGVVVTCTKCGGTGMRRWEDYERAIAAGIPVESWPRHQRNFEKVAECLSGATATVAGRMNQLLGN
jgi:hypothetical protein